MNNLPICIDVNESGAGRESICRPHSALLRLWLRSGVALMALYVCACASVDEKKEPALADVKVHDNGRSHSAPAAASKAVNLIPTGAAANGTAKPGGASASHGGGSGAGPADAGDGEAGVSPSSADRGPVATAPQSSPQESPASVPASSSTAAVPSAPAVAPPDAPSPPTPAADTDAGTRLVIGRVDSSTKVREPEAAAPIEGVVPSLPAQSKLPDVGDLKGAFKVPEDAGLRRTLTDLIGTWRQVEGGNAGDIAEGGYAASEVVFTKAGFMQLVRTFDSQGKVKLTRHVDFLLKAAGKLSVGEANPPQASTLITKKIVIPQGNGKSIVISPATKPLPASLSLSLEDGRLVIDGKTYEKVK